MTMPSTRQRPVLFPDEYVALNNMGYGYAHPRGTRTMPIEVLGTPDSFHDTKRAYEHKVVMDRVLNRKLANRGMEGKLNTTERSQRYTRPASRSAVPNGVFSHSAPGIYTSSNTQAQGGVITGTKGQKWVRERLAERSQEYTGIKNASLSAPAVFPKSTVSIPVSPIQSALLALGDAIQSGFVTDATVTSAQSLVPLLVSRAPILSVAEMVEAIGTVQSLQDSVVAMKALPETGRYALKTETKRALDALLRALKRSEAVLKDIAKAMNYSTAEKELYFRGQMAKLPDVTPFGNALDTQRRRELETARGVSAASPAVNLRFNELVTPEVADQATISLAPTGSGAIRGFGRRRY